MRCQNVQQRINQKVSATAMIDEKQLTNVAVRHLNAATIGRGEKRARVGLPNIRCALSACATVMSSLGVRSITSFRIAAIISCSGTQTTGKRCARRITHRKLLAKMAVLAIESNSCEECARIGGSKSLERLPSRPRVKRFFTPSKSKNRFF